MGKLCYTEILLKGERELSFHELEALVNHCVVVFEFCDEQFPVDLFRRLEEVDINLGWFIDELIQLAGQHKIFRVH